MTALYDIKRADRDVSKYLAWLQSTLRIPRPFVVFCHPAHEPVVRRARGGYMDMTTIITADTFPLEGLAPIVEPIAKRVGGFCSFTKSYSLWLTPWLLHCISS